MTREERINSALLPILKKMREHGATDEMCKMYDNGFHVGAMWADAHPRWVSVEDELPKGFVFITNGDDVLVGKYNFEKGLWGIRNKTMFAYTLLPANWNVTHWMPLPQSPKKGREK